MIWSQKELEQSNNTRISFFNTNNTFIFNKVTGEVRYVNEKKYYIVKDMTK